MCSKRIFIFFFLFIALLSSCSRKNSLGGFDVFSMSARDDIVEVPSDSVFEEISVTLLDSLPLLKDVSDVYESDSSYYILSDGILYRYARDGRFQMQIGRKGRGAGEYLYLRGVSVRSGVIYMFDYNLQNMVMYREDGEYIGGMKVGMKDSGRYFTSFFMDGDDAVLYSSVNSPRQDIFRYSLEDGIVDTISTCSREMLPEEVIVGASFVFGDRREPYFYSNFNDTVFVFREGRLSPSFLMKRGRFAFRYDDLNMNRLINLRDSRISFQWIAAAGRFVFISYIVNMDGKARPYLGLYDASSGKYLQNVRIDGGQGLQVSSSDVLFDALGGDELISVRSVSEYDERYELIRYSF